MKTKYIKMLPTGMITSRAQEKKLEEIRMNNPEFTDYDGEQKEKKTKRSSYEKRTHEFLIECRELLREFKISYDYSGEDFVIDWHDDEYDYTMVIGYMETIETEDTCFVWSHDYEECFFSSDNPLDCINYVNDQFKLSR